jgi:hypothetical protein
MEILFRVDQATNDLQNFTDAHMNDLIYQLSFYFPAGEAGFIPQDNSLAGKRRPQHYAPLFDLQLFGPGGRYL